MMKRIAKCIDPSLWEVSGKVFYSGRAAFSGQALVYVLGINPGGDPDMLAEERVGDHTDWVLSRAPTKWSAYCDEGWKAHQRRPPGPGDAPLQQRVRHLLSGLGLDPRRVPASNLVFTRSRRTKDLKKLGLGSLGALVEKCWPVHERTLKMLRPKALICLGRFTADQVRKRLGVGEYIVSLANGQSYAWRTQTGLIVFSLIHPSASAWTDPTPMVMRVLNSN